MSMMKAIVMMMTAMAAANDDDCGGDATMLMRVMKKRTCQTHTKHILLAIISAQKPEPPICLNKNHPEFLPACTC